MYTTAFCRAGLCKNSTHNFGDLLEHSFASVSTSRRGDCGSSTDSQTSRAGTTMTSFSEDGSSVCGSTAKYLGDRRSSLTKTTKTNSSERSSEPSTLELTEGALSAYQDSLKSKGMRRKNRVQKAHPVILENRATVYVDGRGRLRNSKESSLPAASPLLILNRTNGRARPVVALHCKAPSSLSGISEEEIQDDMERVVRRRARGLNMR